ncbi:MAG: diacylglycerol kinase family protein [Firmicutes bacterium]|nr:diacylglycerol kinase family protein [Bacillota bacterium]
MKHRCLYESVKDALKGIFHVLRTERNMRIHVACGLLVIALAKVLAVTRLEFAILLLVIGMMFVAELINTAFEEVVNLITEEYHPLAGLIKNIAAGAVLVAALVALCVGYIIFKDYIIP